MKKIDIHIHLNGERDDLMDDYVKLMDEHGVAAALVHAIPMFFDEGIGQSGEPPLPTDDEAVLAACRRHPGRLYGSVHIDLRESAQRNIDKIERYAAEGFKSVKMFPNLGFDPNDDAHEPVWAAIETHGLMCFSHCGWLLHNERSRPVRISTLTASPFHYEVPARRHPGINFIFAHFGGGATYLETITLCERLDNCFADSCGGWGVWVWEHHMPGIEDFPMTKFLYGTDSAGEAYSEQGRWWTELLTDMGRTPEELELFFHKNAARLLGIAED